MGDDGFYITLPCNSSRSVYPDNEISKYGTKLARSLILKGDGGVIRIPVSKNVGNFSRCRL